MLSPTISCPDCGAALDAADDDSAWSCPSCPFSARAGARFVELGRPDSEETSDHYSLQWGEDTGFLGFLKSRPRAKSSMASAELGWSALFEEIRERAATRPVSVYDAACGYGGIANELVTEGTAAHLRYVGADIHQAIEAIPKQVPGFDRCGFLVRWDISRPLPLGEKFDFVICRNALHHTPDPEMTFASLREALAPGGTLAISVYAKKAICREALDDRLRDEIVGMSPADALGVSREFTVLGRALQEIDASVEIPEDLGFLGIPKGRYDAQRLIYYHLLKCFYNDEFGERYSTIVNYDWYHPPFAYRYSLDQVEAFFRRNGLELVETQSSDAQHYAVGRSAEGPR